MIRFIDSRSYELKPSEEIKSSIRYQAQPQWRKIPHATSFLLFFTSLVRHVSLKNEFPNEVLQKLWHHEPIKDRFFLKTSYINTPASFATVEKHTFSLILSILSIDKMILPSKRTVYAIIMLKNQTERSFIYPQYDIFPAVYYRVHEYIYKIWRIMISSLLIKTKILNILERFMYED